MLHWLAGQSRPNEHDNDDDTAQLEPPATPAPIFAVRAFKHAIFGTPAPTTTHQKSRRNSTQPGEASRAAQVRPSRPILTRPKSANDANTVGRIDTVSPSSPTKGILLTPGTASGGRSKTVTFGDYKLGKANFEEPARSGRGGAQHSTCSHEPPFDIAEHDPTCTVGKYWKQEYDIYRENTSRELRKLITKQKAAKSYAKDKDEECSALAAELEQERKRVQQLEDRAKDLESQLKAMQAQLLAQQAPRQTRAQANVTHSTESRRGDTIVSEKSAAQILLQEAPLQTERNKRPRLQLRHDSLDPSNLDESDALALDNLRVGVKQPRQTQHAVSDSNPRAAPLLLKEDGEDQSPPVPQHSAILPQTSEQSKGIISREGTIIPPERIAAARARLAARKQSRKPS